MGLLDYFRSFLSDFKWQEPRGYQGRLRGDFLRHLGALAGLWMALSGGLMMLIPDDESHGMALSYGLGAAFAGLLYMMAASSGNSTGTIFVRKTEILRQAVSFSFGAVMEYSKWPYEAIRTCTLVPPQHTGKRFAVMLLYDGDSMQMIGVPRKIDLKKLARHLMSKGVEVKVGQSVPELFIQPLDARIPGVLGVIGGVLLVAGLIAQANGKGNGPPMARKPAEQRPVERQPANDAPAKVQPAAALPDLPQPVLPNAETAGAEMPEPPPGFPQADQPKDGGADGENDDPLAPRMEQPAEEPMEKPSREEPEATGFLGSPEEAGFLPADDPPPAPAPRPATRPRPSLRADNREDGLIGGTGGGPFETASPNGRPLLGVRYAMGSWAGEPALRSLTPIFDRRRPAGAKAVVARNGYAVGGMNVRAPKYVSAIQLVFMRLGPDGRLDPSDSYTSEWLGASSGAPVQTLDGGGRKVVGIKGRRAAVLDAVGLVWK